MSSSWWSSFLQENSVQLGKLSRTKLEELYKRSLDHLRQLTEQELSLFSGLHETNKSSHAPLPSISATNSIILSNDRRIQQLVKTLNSLNSDRLQLHDEIAVLQEMLQKLDIQTNKDKFSPSDVLYSYTFESKEHKSLCSSFIDLYKNSTEDNDNEDLLLLIDLFSSSTLHFLNQFIDKTQSGFQQRMKDFEEDYNSLLAEKDIAFQKVSELKTHLKDVPRGDSLEYLKNAIKETQAKIESYGDTKNLLNAARQNVVLLTEQLEQIQRQTAKPSSNVESVDPTTLIQLRQKKQEKLIQKERLMQRQIELEGKIQQSKSDIESHFRDTERIKAEYKSTADKSDKDNSFYHRIIKANIYPSDLKTVWNWSQHSRLEDLINDIEGLKEHTKLLTYRKESLQRKTEQLAALLKNYDDHIEKLENVIAESEQAE